MNTAAFLTYLKFFLVHVRAKKVRFPVVLVVDGFSAHMQYHSSMFAREHNIILYCLLGNATNILQPCDVAAMQPFKEAFKRYHLEKQVELDCMSYLIERKDYAKALSVAYKSALKRETILSGFRATGLYPFNDTPEMLKKLPKTREEVEQAVEVLQHMLEIPGAKLTTPQAETPTLTFMMGIYSDGSTDLKPINADLQRRLLTPSSVEKVNFYIFYTF